MNITKRKPSTPGEILLEDFMKPYELTQTKLAALTGITRRRINEIIRAKRAVTPDTALRLGKLFNISPECWLNLQMKIDIWSALNKKNGKMALQKIKPLCSTEKHLTKARKNLNYI